MTYLRSSRPLSTAISLHLCLCLAVILMACAEDCIHSIRVERVALSQPANLSCAGLEGDSRSVMLHKEGQSIHNYTINGKDTQVVQVNQNMRLQVQGHHVLYEILQVSSEEAGVYTCEVQRIYPPPYKSEKRMSALIPDKVVHCPEALDQNHTQKHHNPQGNTAALADVPPNQLLLWQATCVGVTLLCVVLLVIILALGYKVRRNARSECEYVNTIPRPTQDTKKTKGVMQPKWAGQLF